MIILYFCFVYSDPWKESGMYLAILAKLIRLRSSRVSNIVKGAVIFVSVFKDQRECLQALLLYITRFIFFQFFEKLIWQLSTDKGVSFDRWDIMSDCYKTQFDCGRGKSRL